ncbi:condensin complex subunit 2-like [Temnothorax longispinosus]|uniref:Condensin complex subunit 2 n=1 Tax=Temnothorax longispinosus TaxID=300112 RepID=A0A4S2KIV2_9HYME|nr:Condensin complex subunit 2 [Temnothorax longispinosus]
MDSRKSLVHKRLETLQNSPTSSSPLRRKSIQTPGLNATTNTLSENDDEAERIARRREMLITSTTPPSTSSKRFSLGLGFLADIPAPQMAESINQCIKLSAENKINVKNAFSLEMIDFMTYMIKKQDANMSNLQVASTSLDVSTKIYGYRVDSVHMEILKMVGGLVIDNAEKSTEEQEEAMLDDAGANVEGQKKKKKKAKQKIFSTVEALRGNVEIAKPMSAMIGETDLQTSDMLYQATLPNHANSGFYLHPYNDVLVDAIEDTPESRGNANAKYAIPAIEDFSDLEICASYSNFEFLNWSVNNEPEEMSEEEAEPDENDNGFQFDLDASVEHDDEPAPEPMNYFDIEHDDDNHENNVQACYRKTADRTDVNVVDVPNVRMSEYSFVQPNMKLHWAGPSHWKFWNFGRSFTATEGGSKVVAACMQAKLRKRKQFEMLYDEARDNIDAKFASSQSIRLHAKTAKAEWSAESLSLPEDVHYDIAQTRKLYLYPKVFIKPASSGDKENGDAATAADVFDGERYDYNNPNDTQEYCPNVEHDDDYDDYGSRDDNDDCNFSDTAAVLGSQGLIGDNLVAAPKLVNKIPIAYCLKAKKIDMRQLKKSIWSCLRSTSDNATAANAQETVDEADTMKESKQFSDVYKALPKLLTKSNAEALSVPISFISMLHLANEKGLKVCSVPDMSDLIIEPGESSLM